MAAMTNRVTVFTKPWPALTVAELGRFVKSLGFDGIELPVRPGFPVTPENVAKGLPEASRILAGEGVAISSVAGPTDERTIEACAAAGCKVLRVLVPVDMKQGYRATEERVRREWEPLVPALRRHGVSIGVQNHCDNWVGSAIGVLHLIERWDPAQFSVVLDPAHCALAGEPTAMAIDIAWPWLSLVNLKSSQRARTNPADAVEAQWETRWTTAKDSGYSWRLAIDELRRRGYQGDFCLTGEYSAAPGQGELTGNGVVEPLRYDRAYLAYLMSDAAAQGTAFDLEDWVR
jgi:sugar phosphate isomerase/epimerase